MSDFSLEPSESSSEIPIREISITIADNSPVKVEMSDEIETTRGYRCGQCCLHCCCNVEYDCCVKGAKHGYTPYTITQGATYGTLLSTAISTCTGTAMLCCTCLSPYGNNCPCNNLPGYTIAYMTAAGCFGLTLLLSCGFTTIKGCNANCGAITNKLGCRNFSRGFDKRD